MFLPRVPIHLHFILHDSILQQPRDSHYGFVSLEAACGTTHWQPKHWHPPPPTCNADSDSTARAYSRSGPVPRALYSPAFPKRPDSVNAVESSGQLVVKAPKGFMRRGALAAAGSESHAIVM